ncbi:MAG: zinc ribbon domain-containing protein [Promethearchaeota archaeon]
MGKEKKKKKKSKIEQKIEEEQIKKIVKRLESEDKEKERVKVEAKMVSSDPKQQGVNVKVRVQILDDSFYAKKAKLFFNAGTENFEDVDMEQIDMDNFAIVLGNIPKEIQILYYVRLLDKSGEWTQFPRPELINPDDPTQEYDPYYSFSVEADGAISYKKLWDDEGLMKCPVCQYACQPTWKTCPECNTPLYDTTQAVFLDEQKAKEKALQERLNAEPTWEDAADEEWRSLPECPNCGYTVQLEWAKCPVCNFDLTTVELQKKASYEEFMTEEEKAAAEQMSEIKKKKEIPKKKLKDAKKELDWEAEDGIDIL